MTLVPAGRMETMERNPIPYFLPRRENLWIDGAFIVTPPETPHTRPISSQIVVGLFSLAGCPEESTWHLPRSRCDQHDEWADSHQLPLTIVVRRSVISFSASDCAFSSSAAAALSSALAAVLCVA